MKEQLSIALEPLVEVSGGYKSGLRTFLPKLAMAITLFVMLLVAVECICYLLLQQQMSTSGEERNFPRSLYKNKPWVDELWREWEKLGSESQYKAYVVWRGSPHQGALVNVDSEGLRFTAHSDCSAGNYTIWMFGNSALFGKGSRDWETIPSLLAARYEASGRKVCVKNYGERGWVGTQELIQLMLALKSNPQRPDLVIFYDGIADAFLPYETAAGDVHGNYETMRSWFTEGRELKKPGFAYLEKSNTYRELLRITTRWDRSGAAHAHAATPGTPQDLARQTVESYVKNTDIGEALAQKFGFRCVFFLQPTALIAAKPLTTEEQRVGDNEENANPGIRAVFRATYQIFQSLQQPDYFYLGDIFSDHPERLFIDTSHVTPEANEIIAAAMYHDIDEAGIGKSNSSKSGIDSKGAN